jgi:hypothetical protein
MNKKRALLIFLCCVLMGAFFVLSVARADIATVTFDSGGWPDYIITDISPDVNGTIQASGNPGNALQGRTTTENSCYGDGFTSAYITVELPNVSTVTQVKVDIQRHASGGATIMATDVTFYNADDQIVSGPIDASSGYAYNTWYTSAYNTPVSGVKKIKVGRFDCGYNDMYVLIDNVSITTGTTVTPTVTNTPTVTPTPDPWTVGWNKPLRGSDQKADDTTFHELTMPYGGTGLLAWPGAQHNENAAIGFSESIANIFAVHDGTITSVLQLVNEVSGGACVEIPMYGGCPTSIYLDFNRYYVMNEGTYRIEESLADGRTIFYFVQNPQVIAGDIVTAGCKIGATIAVKGLNGSDWAIGVVLLMGAESDGMTSFDISKKLINEPSGTSCKAAINNVCTLIANATFTANGGAWQLDPNFWYSIMGHFDDGLSFPISVIQTLNLDSAQQYTITLIYQVEPGASPQRLAVALGTTQTIFVPEASPGLTTYIIPAASYTPDQDSGLYTFRITGLEDAAQTRVYFACVSETGGTIPTPGEGCIVLDPYFSLSSLSSPWFDVASPQSILGDGAAYLPDGADIYQTILLNPKVGGAQQDYDLQITYRRLGIAAAGENVGVDWSFGIQSGSFDSVDNQQWHDAIDTISIVTDPSTDSLELDAVGSNGDQIAQISKVCIVPHDGGTPPGYLPPLPFQGGCHFCVYSPTGDVATDISEFQQWLACQFFQLWECQAKILLRYIWQALINILTLFGSFRLWLSATIIGLANWGGGNLTVFSRWLDGEIHNAVQNIVWAILNWHGTSGGGGTNFWDVLIALINGIIGLLTVFIQLVAQLIQLILQGVIGLLVNVVGLLLGLLQSIINGLNASATSINPDWLPNCTDPNTSLFVVCTAISGIESGLAIGPFALLVPIGIGLAALNLIFWGIRRVTAVFV